MIRTRLRTAAPPVLWLLTAAWMVTDYVADPWIPGRVGTRAYFHNNQGVLVQGLVASAVELVVLMLILRPWSYRGSWLRASGGLLLFVPWMAFTLVPMHAGGVIIVHSLWLACVVAVLATCVVWSGTAALRARMASSATAPPGT